MMLETEIKFALPSFAPVRRALMDLGASFEARYFESNLVLDDPAQSLANSGRLLRLRRGRTCKLTFKAPAGPGEARPGFKVRREIETEVADLDALERVFAALGYLPAKRYEKVREIWKACGLKVCLDLMPFGRFMELEGDPEKIEKIARALGLAMDSALTASYFDLHRQREITGGKTPGADCLFDASARQLALTIEGLAFLMESAGDDPGQGEARQR